MYTSIRPEEIADQKREWPKDRYEVRYVNGDYNQHWAVCDEQTWNIVSLSYTQAEANHICELFNTKGRA